MIFIWRQRHNWEPESIVQVLEFKNNLTKEQRQGLKELKSNDTNAIYPFDKGSGLVLIPKEQAIEKLCEQIGD